MGVFFRDTLQEPEESGRGREPRPRSEADVLVPRDHAAAVLLPLPHHHLVQQFKNEEQHFQRAEKSFLES